MEHFKLTSEDVEELKAIAKYLVERHRDIFAADPNYKLLSTKSMMTRLGVVIGYKGKTIYEQIAKKSISERSLDLIDDRIKALKAKRLTDSESKSYVIRGINLFTKIDKQKISTANEKSTTYTTTYNDLIAVFQNTYWYLYERSAHAIERHIIEFKKSEIEDELVVEIKSNRENTSSWMGKAVFTSTKEFLIINTFYNTTIRTLPLNFIFRVSARYTKIDLCVGHMMSTSDKFHHVVTRLVVLENQPEMVKLSKTRFEIEDVKTRETLSDGIYRLLHDINLNRLSSPPHAIIDEKMLNGWITEIAQAKRYSRDNNILGEYDVFYRGEIASEAITKDLLVIKENLHADLVAEYYHEVDKGLPQKWQGKIFYSSVTRAAFITLRGPVRDLAAESISEIFLTINIPPGGRKFDTVTGIITGVNDSDEGALGFFVVCIKNPPNTALTSDRQMKLEKFFKSKNCPRPIYSPKLAVSNIDDLFQQDFDDLDLV